LQNEIACVESKSI